MRFVFLCFIFITASIHGATIHVPKDYPLIQFAINAANNGDTVLVAPGTYFESIDFLGKAITVKSASGPHVTEINGNNLKSVVVFASNEGSNSVLDGFTIKNGKGGYFPNPRGGGVTCSLASPTIVNNIIMENTAVIGGAIQCDTSSPTIRQNLITKNTSCSGVFCRDQSSPSILNNTITENKKADRGGGVFCLNGSSPQIKNNLISHNYTYDGGAGICCVHNCSPTITNNTISWNEVHDGHGAGIECYNYSSPVISNNLISYNTILYYKLSSDGAGICCNVYSSPMIKNNTIVGNTTKDFGNGGGVCSNNYSEPTITNNTICWNSVNGRGGGVYSIFSSPIVKNNIINGNTASGDGGGVFCDERTNIKNNVIAGNRASEGGGIFCRSGSLPTIKFNTVTENRATFYRGGGIACESNTTVEIRNTIIWNNYAPDYPEIYGYPQVAFSNVKGGYSGSGNINSDPLFVLGPKGPYYLSHKAAGQPADSPCVDGGGNWANITGMDIYWTRTDEITDSGLVDMGFHYGDFTFPSLQADTVGISELSGGSVNLLLLGGLANANKNYLIFGGVSGASPGIVLPPSGVNLPINWDAFTNIVITYANQPNFQNFMGTLDSFGRNEAILNLPPLPGFKGTHMNFAYGLVDGSGAWDFASIPVMVEIIR